MAVDVNLVLDSNDTVTANTDTPSVPVEGGFFSEFRAYMGAMTGGSTTHDMTIQYSPDNQVTWYECAKIPQFGPTNDNAEVARVGYVPISNSPATYPTYLRVHHVVTGGAPSYTVVNLFAKPLTSLAIPDVDIKNTIGYCNGIAAV